MLICFVTTEVKDLTVISQREGYIDAPCVANQIFKFLAISLCQPGIPWAQRKGGMAAPSSIVEFPLFSSVYSLRRFFFQASSPSIEILKTANFGNRESNIY